MTDTRTDAIVSPSGIAVSKRQVKLVYGGLMLAVLLASLDQTIVTTALPTIVGDLGGLNHLSWVVTSYLLATTVSAPLYGKLGDLYGRKRLFQVALAMFFVASALCGIAHTMPQLIAFRALQGFGSGGLIVGAQAIVGDLIAPAERGRYAGLMGSMYAFASVIGPLVGGLLTEHLSWRWVFYINLPLGLVTALVITTVMPDMRRHIEHRIDYVGIALLSTAVTALILLLTWGGSQYAWASRMCVGLAMITVVTTAAFLRVELRAPEPLIPLYLFRNSVYVVCCLATALLSMAMLSVVTFFPLFLQTVHLVSPTMSGFQTSPIVVGLVVASFITGRMLSRSGRYRIFPIVGSLAISVGLILIALLATGVHAAYWPGAIGMVIFGLGMGSATVAYTVAMQNSVPYADLGAATATFGFLRSIGNSIGVAIFGGIFAHRLADQFRGHGERLQQLGRQATHLTPKQIKGLKTSSPASFSELVNAFHNALHAVFFGAVPFVIAGTVVAFFLKEIPLRKTQSAGVSAAESQLMPEAAETSATTVA